jgi:hypothetical protein
MGYSNSIIAIKGNHIDKTDQIFKTFKYFDLEHDKQFGNWPDAASYLFDNFLRLTNEDIAIRGVWANDSWTIICDPEMVDIMEEDMIEDLSVKLKTTVFTFLIHSTSGTYEFARYEEEKQRHFQLFEGVVVENEGDPLPEEDALNINEKITEEDLTALAGKLGIDLSFGNISTKFTVKELGYNDEL